MIFDVAGHGVPSPCSAFAQSPQALTLDDGVRMYFSSRSTDGDCRVRSHAVWAEFDCDFRVSRVAAAPVVSPGALGCYDEHGVFPLNVLRDAGRVLGFIGGWSRRVSVQVDGAVGLAVSDDDGLSFRRLGDGPVLSASLHQPFLVGDPFVIKAGGLFHMWHIYGIRWRRFQPGGQPERVYKIGHAISADAVTWERTAEAAPLIADVLGEDECQALPTVALIGSTWHMLFCFRQASGFRHDPDRSYRIGHAWSDDLATWTREDGSSGLDVSRAGWDSEMMCYPHLFTMGGDVFCAYNGNAFGKAGFGLARLVEL